MRLFAGLERTDYQDILRALGYLCDAHGWRNLRVIEYEDGLIVGHTEGPNRATFVVHFFTDADLQELLREAYTRRGETDKLTALRPMEPPPGDKSRGG